MSVEEAEVELARIWGILAALTPLSADRTALRTAEQQMNSGGAGGDSRLMTLLCFRVARKAALHARADAMRARLCCDLLE